MRTALSITVLSSIVAAHLGGCSLDDVPLMPDGSGGPVGPTPATSGSGGAPATDTTGAGATGGSTTGGGTSTGGSAGAPATTGPTTATVGTGTPTTAGTGGGTTSGSGGAGGQPIDASIGDSCTPESDNAFCTRLKRDCGTFTSIDNCGASRMAMCGTCTTPATCGGGGTIGVCSGGGLVNRAQGGTITSSVAMDPKPTEDKTKVFDNDVMTKWYASTQPTPWIAYQFAGGATYVITSYSVTSANDTPTRDPAAWRLEGTNDPTLANWTPLDVRMNQTFAGRFQTNTYSFANGAPFNAYRFFVTANATAPGCQFAEIQLFGNAGPKLDAGRD